MSRKAISIAFLVVLSSLMLVAAGCGSKKSADTATSAVTEAPPVTDTTATESTETTATETTATQTDSGGSGASAQECEDFAKAASSVGQEFQSALTGAGGTDITQASKAFDELAAKAPADIKDDFQTIDSAFKKMAVALKGVDLSSGKTPDAGTLAKLQALSTQIDTAKLTQASTNISTWASTNCGKG